MELHQELFSLVLEHLDHRSLARVATVSKAWQEHARDITLWEALFQKRWHVTEVKNKRLNQPGPNGITWKELYAAWTSIDKAPSCHGDLRQPIWARTEKAASLKRKRKRGGGAADGQLANVFVTLRHADDCTLGLGSAGQHRRLTLYSFIQNTSNHPLKIATDQIRLVVKCNNPNLNSQNHATRPVHVAEPPVVAKTYTNNNSCAFGPKNCHHHLQHQHQHQHQGYTVELQAQWDLTVVKLTFAFEQETLFEPFALERCVRMCVPISSGKGDPIGEATAVFQEGLVDRFFQHVNGNIWFYDANAGRL